MDFRFPLVRVPLRGTLISYSSYNIFREEDFLLGFPGGYYGFLVPLLHFCLRKDGWIWQKMSR